MITITFDIKLDGKIYLFSTIQSSSLSSCMPVTIYFLKSNIFATSVGLTICSVDFLPSLRWIIYKDSSNQTVLLPLAHVEQWPLERLYYTYSNIIWLVLNVAFITFATDVTWFYFEPNYFRLFHSKTQKQRISFFQHFS